MYLLQRQLSVGLTKDAVITNGTGQSEPAGLLLARIACVPFHPSTGKGV